jgi:hypothetical protein
VGATGIEEEDEEETCPPPPPIAEPSVMDMCSTRLGTTIMASSFGLLAAGFSRLPLLIDRNIKVLTTDPSWTH